MRITPYCTLQNISEFVSYPEALCWLSTAKGNDETKILRRETFLSASAAVEYENHYAHIESLAMEDQAAYECVWDLVESRDGGQSRRDALEQLARDEREVFDREEEERRERNRYGNGLNFRTADSDDENYCLWRRWAGDD